MIILAQSDDPEIQVIKDELKARSNLIVRVETGKALLDTLRSIRARLLVVDSRLPGLGEKLLPLIDKVRDHFSPSELPILLIAPEADREKMVEGLKRGVNMTLYKPYDPEIALSQILVLLSMKQAYEEKNLPERPGHETTMKVIDGTGPQGTFIHTVEDAEYTFPHEMDLEIRARGSVYKGRSIYFSAKDMQLQTERSLPLCKVMALTILENGIALAVKEMARGDVEDRNLPLKLRVSVEPNDAYHALLDQWLRVDPAATAGTLPDLTIEDVPSETPKKEQAPDDGAQRQNYLEKSLAELQDVTPDSALPPQKPGSVNDSIPDQQPLKTAAGPPAAEQRLPKAGYEFIKNIGRGNFASVYLVRDRTLGRMAAMKVLNPSYAKDPNARRHFLGEARIAARFHHPNIVSVYQVGELMAEDYEKHLDFPDRILRRFEERINFITMEWVEGQTLREWIGLEEHPSEHAILDLLTQVTQALAFAHKKGVIHRDIKPANILLTPDLRVKVADFGIAMVLESGDPNKRTLDDQATMHATACTPKYASPEQLKGRKPDLRTDLYSLGIMAYEMIDGLGPFRANSLRDLVRQHLDIVPEPPQCSKGLADIVMRLIEKKAEDRFQDANNLLTAITDVRATASQKHGNTLRGTMVNLVSESLVCANRVEASDLLCRLLELLDICEARGEHKLVVELKNQLSGPSLVNLFLEKLLDEEYAPLLQAFFVAMSSNKLVPNLLRRFKDAGSQLEAHWLGEFALISAGEEQKLLVQYGLELPDRHASTLVACFTPEFVISAEPLYLMWSRHQGFLTQSKLLDQVAQLRDREVEMLNVLNFFANGDGTAHAYIRNRASHMLQRHLLLHG